MQIEEDRRLEERRSKEKGLGKVLSKVFTLQRAEIRQLKPPFLESFSLESENSFLNYKIDLLYAALFPGEGAPSPKRIAYSGQELVQLLVFLHFAHQDPSSEGCSTFIPFLSMHSSKRLPTLLTMISS